MLVRWVFLMSVVLLAYIYAGYPAWIWAMAHWRARPVRKAPFSGKAAVLIAAHDEEESLPRKVAELLDLARHEPIGEILVGLDGCTDATADRLQAMDSPLLRVLGFPERRGKAAVLNDLMVMTTQPVLLMMDARQRVEPDAVAQILTYFADPHVGVVSGALMYESTRGAAQKGAESYWGYEKFIRLAESRYDSVPGATGALYAVRRELCAPIPEATLVDDVLIPMRAVLQGYRCLFEPMARVWDRPQTAQAGEAIRKRRTLAGIWQLLWLEPKLLSPRANPIWFQWMSHKVLRLATPALLLLLLLGAGGSGSPALQSLFWGGLFGAALSAAAYGFGACFPSRLWGVLGALFGVNWALLLAAWDAMTGRLDVKWQRGERR